MAGEFPGIGVFGMQFSGFINNLELNSSYIPVTGFGSLDNLTTDVSLAFEGIQFSPGANMLSFWLGDYVSQGQPYTQLNTSFDDQIHYSPSVDSITFDMSYSDFNPGTYQAVYPAGMVFNNDTIFNLTVGPAPVPEPTTLVLIALGGVACLLQFRRRRA